MIEWGIYGKEEDRMERWKINLAVLFTGSFLTMGGMTMIIPFLPLYIQELGIHDPTQVSLWAGLIFSANFLTSFIFQPIWGGLADRYGRKPMLLRSGYGMAIIVVLTGFAGNPWHLLFLRLLNGVVSGYNPAAATLMATNSPRERMGFVMGVLQSGAVSGTILGPLFGGLLAEWVGYRPIFYITGALIFIAALLTHFMVKESFDASKADKLPKGSILRDFKELCLTKELPILFMVTIALQFSMQSSLPLIPLFVQELHGSGEWLAFYSGLVGSITGFSNMIAAPYLGKLGDRLGSQKILFISLIGAGLAFIPSAFVTNIWQLFAARFLLGMFIGGMLPSIQTLIHRFTPESMQSRSFSFNTSAFSLGNLLGPVVGGAFYGFIGIRGIFIITAVLLFLIAVTVYLFLLRGRSGTQRSTARS